MDKAIWKLLHIYQCAHAPSMHLANKPQRLLSITKNVMANVVVMNEKSYKFTNAVKVLLNTPPNALRKDTLAGFMLEKLFEKVEQQQ